MIMPFNLRYMQMHKQGALLIFNHLCTNFFFEKFIRSDSFYVAKYVVLRTNERPYQRA